jgi:hypothetical protein
MNLRGEFFYTFDNSASFNREHLANPLFAAASAEYYCSSGAFGNVNAVKKGHFDKYETVLEKNLQRFIAKRDQYHEYGWMNFGDWFGERKYNWGNNEYDLAFTMALFFARTADSRYFRRGMEMADHYQSVDRYTPRDDMEKRTKYEHCSGHTGNNDKFHTHSPRIRTSGSRLVPVCSRTVS